VYPEELFCHYNT